MKNKGPIKLNHNSLCYDKGPYYNKPFNTIPLHYLFTVYFKKKPGFIYRYMCDNLVEILNNVRDDHFILMNSINQVQDCVKIKYYNKTLANLELKRIRSNINNDYKPVRSYLCENCGMWHLTSKSNAILEKFEKQQENMER